MSPERGTASIEWVALLAVVGGVLLAAGVGGAGLAPAVPRAVAASFERAFCLVAGGDCLGGRPRPCVLRTHARERRREASLALLRLADGRSVLREERSDGTVVVSVEDVVSAGARFGVSSGLTIGGRGVDVSAGVGGDARGGRGRRFVVAGAAAADRLIERLGEERTGARAVAEGHDLAGDERWWAAGQGAAADAAATVRGLGATARADAERLVGIRERPATGERTLVLRADGELLAALTAPLSRLGMGAPGSASVELALDARRSPLALTVRVARGVHGDAKVGPLRSGGGDLAEAEARLDLSDPVTRALAAALLSRRAPSAARALGARIAERARIDVRVYETDRTESVKGASGGVLLKGGYEVIEVLRTGRLVAAAGREPGMGWARRIDCVGVA